MDTEKQNGTGTKKAGARRNGRAAHLGNGKAAEALSQSAEGMQIVTTGPTIEFHYNGQRVAAVAEAEKPWFVANHLCGVLNIANPRAALSRLDDDEKGVALFDTPGGKQEVNVVSESGLYALIFSSRKPEAKAFRRWITGEVIPAIRKAGRYEAAEAQAQPASDDPKTILVKLPAFGRFVVTLDGQRPCHIHQTAFGAGGGDMITSDCRVLAHTIGIIEAYWHRWQERRGLGDPEWGDGFSYRELERSVLEAGRLARHDLALLDERDDRHKNAPTTTH